MTPTVKASHEALESIVRGPRLRVAYWTQYELRVRSSNGRDSYRSYATAGGQLACNCARFLYQSQCPHRIIAARFLEEQDGVGLETLQRKLLKDTFNDDLRRRVRWAKRHSAPFELFDEAGADLLPEIIEFDIANVAECIRATARGNRPTRR